MVAVAVRGRVLRITELMAAVTIVKIHVAIIVTELFDSTIRATKYLKEVVRYVYFE